MVQRIIRTRRQTEHKRRRLAVRVRLSGLFHLLVVVLHLLLDLGGRACVFNHCVLGATTTNRCLEENESKKGWIQLT